jgi:hypothetical protein
MKAAPDPFLKAMAPSREELVVCMACFAGIRPTPSKSAENVAQIVYGQGFHRISGVDDDGDAVQGYVKGVDLQSLLTGILTFLRR